MSDALVILLLLVGIALQLLHMLSELMGTPWPAASVSRRRRTGITRASRNNRRRVSVAPWLEQGGGGYPRGMRDPGEGESSWPSFLLN